MIFSKNILLLLFLYFIQGLPYGFQASFLPAFLRQQGISLTTVGLFKLLLAPWLCKALWAPLVDHFGTKHKWLLWSIGGLMLTCLCGCFISPDQTGPLSLVLFLLNVFAATQDITVDAIAVALLDSNELGKGNTAQVVGYKIGSIFGGGVLVWFIDVLGWTGLFAALTVLYVEAWMFVFVSPSLREFDMKMRQKNAPDVITDYANIENMRWQDSSSVFTNDSSSSELFPEQSLRHRQRCEDVSPDGFVLDQHDSSEDDIPESASHLHAKLIRKAKMRSQQKKDTAENVNVPASNVDSAAAQGVDMQNGNLNVQQFDAVQQSPSKSEKINIDWTEEISDMVDEEIVDIAKEEIDPALSDSNIASNDLFSNLRKRHATQSPAELDIQQAESQMNPAKSKQEDLADSSKPATSSSKGKEALNLDSQDTIDTPPLGRRQLNSEEYVADAEDNDNSDDVDRVGGDGSSEERGSSVISDDDEDDDEGGLAFLRRLLRVPGTQWMMLLVLLYKLGEQGCIGMLPQFLVDQHVKLADVTFWKGLMGQGVGIVGSLIGGWLATSCNIPLYLLIQQLCLLRLLPVGGLLAVVSCWAWRLVPPNILYLSAIPLLCLLLLLGGAVTTVTFTFMMQCSKTAPPSVQATHYTTLATLEVFGKLGFMSLAGWLTDMLGYPAMFVLFTILSATILLVFDHCPDDLKLLSQRLEEKEEMVYEKEIRARGEFKEKVA